MGLALDVGLAGFPLRVERVEFEVEVMLGRLAGIDRAAQHLAFGRHGHRRTSFGRREKRPFPAFACFTPLRAAACLTSDGAARSASCSRFGPAPPFLARKPKKRGPDQGVPVMARAMVERLA